ncbi:MAG: hypothetical protein Q7O66_00720, partial [Dehalococcoidia bacterium]|nr:hypothetical protein [Dehalococcoidia bacterium]
MRHRLYPLVSVSIMFVILLLVLLVEGCSSAPEPQSTPATPSTQTTPPKSATPATPTKPTGSLVIAGYFGSGSLDPADASPNTFQGMSAAVFDSIVEMSPEGQIRPG